MPLFAFADIDAEYAKDSNLKPEDVAMLYEWQCNQPHLPPPFHSVATALFLQTSNYSIEVAKQRIEKYFTIHTHCPELFANCDPFAPDLHLTMISTLHVILPELTPDGYLVSFSRLINPNVDIFNFANVAKMCLMVSELTVIQRGYHRGYVVIIDMEGGTFRHFLKMNILTMKKVMIYMQTALPLTVKSIHFVNGLPFANKVVALMRPFLNKHLKNSLHVHYGNNSTVFKFVPKEILPIECGGLTFCAKNYYNTVTRRNVELNAENIKMTEHLIMHECKRPGKPKDASELFGVEGTFKQLQID